MSKAVAVRQPSTVSSTRAMIINPPAEIETFDVDANETISNDGGSNRQVPIIRVLQSNSPQVADPRDGGIPGAKNGSFFNTVTREVFDGRDIGLFMIPVHKHRMVVEYMKRDEDGRGGGFVNAYEPENPIVAEAWDRRRAELGMDPGKPIFGKIPNGETDDGKPLELVDTYYIDSIFVVPNDDGSYPGHFGMWFYGSMAFQSTFIPSYNSWDERRKTHKYLINGKMSEPALWTTIWRLRTSLKKRSATQQWMIPNLTLAAIKDDGTEDDYRNSRLPRKFEDGTENPLYRAAVDFNVALLEGAATLDLSKDTADESGATADRGGDHEEIPFPKD